jgi:hypothetical protein
VHRAIIRVCGLTIIRPRDEGPATDEKLLAFEIAGNYQITKRPKRNRTETETPQSPRSWPRDSIHSGTEDKGSAAFNGGCELGTMLHQATKTIGHQAGNLGLYLTGTRVSKSMWKQRHCGVE